MLPPVQAEGNHVLVGGPQLRAQVRQRAQPRQDARFTFVQQRQQFFRAAEKTGVPAHDYGKAPKLIVRMNKLCNRLRRDGLKPGLPGPGVGEHPFRADHAVCAVDRLPDLRRHRLPAPGPDADDRHLRRPAEAVSFTQKFDSFGQASSRQLRRTPDDDQLCADLRCRFGLLCKTARAAAVFRDEVLRVYSPQHRRVQLLRKRPLHRDDLRRRQPRLPACAEGILHRQHPGANTLRKTGNLLELQQLFASRREENIPLGLIQKSHRRRNVRDEYSPRRGVPVFPQHAHVVRPHLRACLRETFRYHRGIGVRRVDDEVEVFRRQQRGHVLRRQPS